MSNRKLGRREFLWLAVSGPVSLPILSSAGCDSAKRQPTAIAPQLGPKESLKKLILMVGPWPTAQKEQADDFTRRFLANGHTLAPYLPQSSKSIQSLAGHFPDDVMFAEKINLGKLPTEERRLLTNLTAHIYSFVEIRLTVCKHPPQGECQSGGLPYTSVPL